MQDNVIERCDSESEIKETLLSDAIARTLESIARMLLSDAIARTLESIAR